MDKEVLGAVFAGGQALRFGADKANALFEGQSLIDHVVAALAGQTDVVVVVGRSHGDLVSVADRPRAGIGPLGALAGALNHARVHGFSAVLSAPCDVPILPRDLAERLGGAGAAYVEGLPVIGWWPSALAEHLARWLAEDRSLAMRHWAAAVGARAVALDAVPPNVNTVADLAALRR